MKIILLSLALLVCLALASVVCAAQQQQGPMPLQSLALSRTQIAFEYAGDIWIMERSGGEAHRLTTHPALERLPVFSPDGAQVAFSRYNPAGGPFSWDVYVVAASGGEPQRLTYHPDADLTVGWTPDSKNVLFTSFRDRYAYLGYRLYTIPREGGFPTPLPIPSAIDGSYAPDGKRVAYTPLFSPNNFSWRNYRGGLVSWVTILNLADGTTEDVPRGGGNDRAPMWAGDRLYFISDRDGTANLFSYDPATRKVAQLTRYERYDIKSAAAFDDTIAFVQDGRVHLLDLKTGATHDVDVRVTGDFPEVKPRTIDAARWLGSINLSPNGNQILFGARGEILTVNVESGESVNLTKTSGVAERNPVWSPDGKSIAYFSDESGEYQLHIRPAQGGQDSAVRRISIEQHPSFYNELGWSPDSKKLAFSDSHLNLWYVDLDRGGAAIKVDTATHTDGTRYFHPSWSPDSLWITYSKYQANRQRAIFVHSLKTGASQQVSSAEMDARWPTFDLNGRYLYFTASTNSGPVKYGMSAMPFGPQVTRSLYAVVLRNGDPSPLSALADQRQNADESSSFRIDVDDINRRVVRVPVDGRNPDRLMAGKPGVLFVVDGPVLYRFVTGTQKPEKFIEGAGTYRISTDGSRLLLRRSGRWAVVSADAPPSSGDAGVIQLKPMQMTIDPRAEWRQIYNEAWHVVREYFYDPHFHGQNLDELAAHYRAYLPNIVTRDDLNHLGRDMFSQLSVSHITGIEGGDTLSAGGTSENIGLLGADFQVDGGRYRIAHIYRGNNSVEGLQAPLGQPGLDVREGDYLLAVDGEELSVARNLFQYFIGKAGKPVEIKVAAQGSGQGARTFKVVPLASEYALRQYDWIERNRRRVRELSGGRLAYIYLPDTSTNGYETFNREFYAQLDRQGLILDERFNAGGVGADYIIEALRRAPLQSAVPREGGDISMPVGMINGPKVMLINEMAGSGGDTLAWMWRQSGIGPIVGKRTSGLGVGASGQDLIDGGRINVPDWGWYNPTRGIWDIENHGVAPDIEVEITIADWRAGRDPQLERAVQIALEQLRRRPATQPRRPTYPVFR
ncbi:MAG TPA: PDZ domain-containing protein [Pyrinomonadaceae bacterium]|nr:PDZ domain-containing protein [Pyrinomonadaceae bacterium]